jgi:hypothetical protein
MAFAPRIQRQEEMVSPKQREALDKRKAEYLSHINEMLNGLADSPYKQDLMQRRDHCFTKFPIFPVDLSIWVIAYFEDWLREFDRVPPSFR